MTIFQIVVQCPGLCCSRIPFIDPGQHSRAPGCRSQSCSVSTRPLVRHHNTQHHLWSVTRDKHQPSHPFLLFNPKIPISSELSLIDFLYEKIFCALSTSLVGEHQNSDLEIPVFCENCVSMICGLACVRPGLSWPLSCTSDVRWHVGAARGGREGRAGPSQQNSLRGDISGIDK